MRYEALYLLLLASPCSSFLKPALTPRIQSPWALSVQTAATYDFMTQDVPTTPEGKISIDITQYNCTNMMNKAIRTFTKQQQIDDAMSLISAAENAGDSLPFEPDPTSYILVMKSLVDKDETPEYIMSILQRMKSHCHVPAAAYNTVLAAWANIAERRPEAPDEADKILEELWSMYAKKRDHKIMPSRATYMAVMASWARSKRGKRAAERVEALLEDMEAHSERHPSLSPVAAFLNVALTAWSRSGSAQAIHRCLDILQRMEDFANAGRNELAPNTISFNIVIDAIARSRKRGDEWKAEELLDRMEQLSREDPGIWQCQPNSVSYNTVLKCWSQCRQDGAVQRAEEILSHMERRYETKATDVRPDEGSYSNVIHAWANSRSSDAVGRSFQVLQRMETAYENGNIDAKPGTMVYNTIMNVLSKSKDRDVLPKSLELFESMKSKGIAQDVFTYTSLVNVLAKSGSLAASNKASELLQQMLDEYTRTKQPSIKPNVRTFTAVINAIGRSRERPERVKDVLESMKSLGVEPDSICFNAAINAWGWSSVKGKELKVFGLLQEMIDSSNAKPDIITCNSILDCCAFATVQTESERSQVMEIASKTLEIFSSQAPRYGWPDQHTFANMLLTVARVMPEGEKRNQLGEAIFWKCTEAGHAGPLAIQRLRLAVSEEKLAEMLGSVIVQNDESKFIFNMELVPPKWKRYIRRQPHNNVRSRSSEKAASRQFTKEKKRMKRR